MTPVAEARDFSDMTLCWEARDFSDDPVPRGMGTRNRPTSGQTTPWASVVADDIAVMRTNGIT
jgi:hypothetical protein